LPGRPGTDDDEVEFGGTHVRISRGGPAKGGAGPKYINRPMVEGAVCGELISGSRESVFEEVVNLICKLSLLENHSVRLVAFERR